MLHAVGLAVFSILRAPLVQTQPDLQEIRQLLDLITKPRGDRRESLLDSPERQDEFHKEFVHFLGMLSAESLADYRQAFETAVAESNAAQRKQ